MGHDIFRRVIALGPFAIKVPRPRSVLHGLRCNRWEREMWYRLRPVFGWETFARSCSRIRWDSLSSCRARNTQSRWKRFRPPRLFTFRNLRTRPKPRLSGLVNGRVLALDYGLPGRDTVSKMRAYYADMSGR